MKIRQGFVSNSSSSSFIIGIKDEKKFILFMNGSLGSRFGTFVKEVVESYFYLGHYDKIEKIDIKEDYVHMYTENGEEEFWMEHKDYEKLKDKGFTFYWGSFPGRGDGGDAIENDLCCNLEMDILTDDFYFKKEAGY